MKEKLLKFINQRDELKNQANSILANAEKENRPLNAEDKEKLDGLKAKISDWDTTIKEYTEMSEPVAEPINKAEPPKVENKFANLGEQLKAVYDAAQPTRTTVDQRLYNVASGNNETVPSEGGFLVQTDFASELLRNIYETGILAPRCRRIPISANSNGIKINAINESSRADGSRFGGVQAYWISEADQYTASKPTFRQMELSLQKLTGACYATDELLQDSAALESVISQAFASEFGFKMDDAILNGTGTGQPLGILNNGNGSLVTVTPTATAAEVVKVEDLVAMYSRLFGRSRANAVWFINQEIEPYLYTLKLGDIPVFIPGNSMANRPFNTLLGLPIIPIEQANTKNQKGDIILADLSQYLLADKGGINSASSIHVRFLYDESVFKFTYRVDGQPIWNTALTPYKGANSLSPFVTLGGRS